MFEYKKESFYGKRIKTIGSGGYGEVALYRKGQQVYAIKWQAYDVDALTEIAILKSLDHPNVVKIIDISHDPNLSTIGIVMNYAGYGTAVKAKKHCISTVGLIYQFLCGVSYIHSQDIEHRDLKPENLLVFDGCVLKIADFGASDFLRCARPGKTLNSPVGTLWYRSPELLLGSQNHTLASDMWAVGCIIYELLTGKPFVTAGNEFDMMDDISKKLGNITTTEWPSVDTLPGYQLYLEYPKYSREPDLFDNLPDWKDILNDLLVYNPARRKSAYEILLNPIFDGVRERELEYPLRGCIENLDFRRPKFPETKIATSDLIVIIVKSWMFEVKKTYNTPLVVFSLGCELLDLILAKKNVKRHELQKLGATCMLIASEIRELISYSIEDYAWVAKSDIEAIASMRNSTLKALDFDIILSCPVDYINLYGPLYPPKVQELALNISSFLVVLDEKHRHNPKTMGFSCIVLACAYYQEKVLHANLITEDLRSTLKNFFNNCGPLQRKITPITEDFENKTKITSICEFEEEFSNYMKELGLC